MKESKFLGMLLPSHPDFLPIEKAIREKYGLPEISPDDEPITEIYLGDENIPLEEFRKDIENRVRENLTFLPPEILKIYLPAKAFSEIKYESEIESYPPELQKQMMIVLNFAKTLMDTIVQIIDPMIDAIVQMLYTEELYYWYSKCTGRLGAERAQHAPHTLCQLAHNESHKLRIGSYIHNSNPNQPRILRTIMKYPWNCQKGCIRGY